MPLQISRPRCPTCNKFAEERVEVMVEGIKFSLLTCGHLFKTDKIQIKATETLISIDGDADCLHEWNVNKCTKCGAYKPFPYQEESAKFAFDNGMRCGIFHEPGLGKTICALRALLYNPDEFFPALWCVKAGLLTQFQREIIRWLGIKFVAQIVKPRGFVIPGLKNYVVSIDSLANMNGTLDGIKFKTIIVDECQLIKTWSAQRTIAVRKYAEEIPYILALSGTPIKNRPQEYYSILHLLKPMKFPTYDGFVRRWVRYVQNGTKWTAVGLNDPERFQSYTSDFIIRKTKDEVMPDLPKVNRNFFFTNMEDKEEYDNILDDLEDAVNKGAEIKMFNQGEENILALMARLRHEVGLAKIDATVEKVIEHLEDTDRKIAIFCHHKDVQTIVWERINEYCNENGLVSPSRLVSDMDMETRQQEVDKFRDASRVMVLSTLASGEGLNLQFCSDFILMERQWNPANEEQAEARFERIGQVNSIFGTYIVAVETIDEYFCELVEKKRSMLKEVMDGKESPWDETALIKELITITLQKRNGKKYAIQ